MTDPHRPIVTVDHLGEGEYRVRAIHDPRYRLPDWLGLGCEISAAGAAALEREYGSGTLAFEPQPAITSGRGNTGCRPRRPATRR